MLKEFDKAYDAYIEIQGKISELDKYYASPEWKEDFDASEKGELPKDLLCGVLSEDGINNMVEENMQLLKAERQASRHDHR